MPNQDFSFAQVFEMVADLGPDRIAVATSDGVALTYAQVNARADRLALALLDLGVQQGDRVAMLAHNRLEWADVVLAGFKLGAMVANINYRYTAPEIEYLLADAEPRVVIAEIEYAEILDQVMGGLAQRPPHVLYIEGADSSYERALAAVNDTTALPTVRGGDYLVYTGGTTGYPKGVVWSQQDLLTGAIGGWASGEETVVERDEIAQRLTQPRQVIMSVSPLMHGTAQWSMLRSWSVGGTAVLWTGRNFRPEGVWDCIEQHAVGLAVIIGDAMAVPLVEELESAPQRWDLSELHALGSGGVVLSPGTKDRLRAQLPQLTIIDGYGGSEIGAVGTYLGLEDGAAPRFSMLERVHIVGDDLTPVAPGETGLLAISGPTAGRYWRDEQKSAEVFRTAADGTRWTVPGDWAFRNDDGTVSLLGRGSLAINSGGEKIFPDEVETVLRQHPAVADALAVGTPHEVLGQTVTAVVSPLPDKALSLDDLQAFARRQLAGYKVPRGLVLVDEIKRSPVGKPDYRWAREVAGQ